MVIYLLEIDGSYGEGGGQILRNAVAFSTFTKIPIKITKIRANRPNPGIKAQHYTAIKCIKELCNAETKGLEIGSSTLEFKPGDFKSGNYKFDIGTAGSITLVFQACILASLKTNSPVTIRLTGGTDTKWSPPWDYFQHVFIPLIKKTSVLVDTKLIKRGYYPKGGGEASIIIHPCNVDLKPLQLDKEQKFFEVNGIVHIAGLPDHISKRIKHTAIETLLKRNLRANIEVEQTSALSPGTGITLWTESENTTIGSTSLGEKGLSSEEIGRTAALNLLNEIDSYATLDIHGFDQLLPYMVKAKGLSSCIVQNVSTHAQTNMWLIKQFFDVKFEIKQDEKNYKIFINNL
jgi:RNA 3'-phosphate cyclase